MFVKENTTNGISKLTDREVLILFAESCHPPKDMLTRVRTMMAGIGSDNPITTLVNTYHIKSETAERVLVKWGAKA